MTNEISMAPVATASNANKGAVFGTAKVASSDFESFFNNMLNSEEESVAEPVSLTAIAQEENKSEVLMQLQMLLGEDAGAEEFGRIINLLENGTLSVQANTSDLSKEDFENLTVSILERLDIAIKQMMQTGEESTDFSDREKFLNLITDLLKTGIISSQEYETAIKNPEISSLNELFNDLKKEAQSLLNALKTPENTETAENSEAINLKTIHSVKHLVREINNLIQELGIENEEIKGFYDFINDLIQNGLISIQDLEVKANYTKEIEFSEITAEELEPYMTREMVKELWQATKEGNEGKKQEILELLKQVAQIKAETPNAQTNALFENVEKTDKESKKDMLSMLKNAAESNTESQKQSNPTAQPAEKNVQPEVRAVWEADGLKIEMVNPKTGEKLQTVNTPMSSSMQERIQEFEIIKQVVAQAKLITTPTGEQRMTLFLNPEHLGSVDLRITLNNAEMQIHARVDTVVAQQALENQIGLLREGLEKQGINLERLEVSVEQRERQDAYSLNDREHNEHGQGRGKHRRGGRETHLEVSIKKDVAADTGRRLGYNTMEYLA